MCIEGSFRDIVIEFIKETIEKGELITGGFLEVPEHPGFFISPEHQGCHDAVGPNLVLVDTITIAEVSICVYQNIP